MYTFLVWLVLSCLWRYSSACACVCVWSSQPASTHSRKEAPLWAKEVERWQRIPFNIQFYPPSITFIFAYSIYKYTHTHPYNINSVLYSNRSRNVSNCFCGQIFCNSICAMIAQRWKLNRHYHSSQSCSVWLLFNLIIVVSDFFEPGHIPHRPPSDNASTIIDQSVYS